MFHCSINFNIKHLFDEILGTSTINAVGKDDIAKDEKYQDTLANEIAMIVDYINEFLVLKKTLFTKDKYKCGFPEESLNDYLRVFQNHNLDIEIIDDKKQKSDIKLILKDIDINNITPIEALLKLKQIKELVDD